MTKKKVRRLLLLVGGAFGEVSLGVEEATDAVDGAGLAEDEEGFHEGWGLGGTGEDGAEEHEIFLDRPLLELAEGLHGGLDGIGFPRGGLKSGKEIGGEGEGVFERAFFGDEDIGGGHDVVGEKEAGHVAELGEGFDAVLDEGGDVAEIVIGEDGAAESGEEVLGGEAAEVLAVEPFELGEVEDGAAEGDLLETELREHVGEGEEVAFLGVEGLRDDLMLGGLGHATAHEAEEVEQGLREEAGLTVEDEGDGVLALGDLALVGVAEKRHVPEAGALPTEGLVEKDVLGGGGDPLFGADDVGDAHEVIVDDVGEVVGGEAIGLEQDLIVDVVVIEGDVAAEFVAEGGTGVLGDAEADGERLAGC